MIGMKTRRKVGNAARGKNSGRPLPDAKNWEPRNASKTLAAVFSEECKVANEARSSLKQICFTLSSPYILRRLTVVHFCSRCDHN